jgi:hypothetical protein
LTRIQAVHERLMAQLPVRTVPTRREFDDSPFNVPTRPGGRPRAEEVRELNRRILALRAAGHTFEEIRAFTGASTGTIARHVNGQVATISQQRQHAAKRR